MSRPFGNLLAIACCAVFSVACGADDAGPDASSPIQLVPVVSFQDAGGQAAVRSFPGSSALTRRGTYLVSDPMAIGIISEFDSAGAFLRNVGARGSGPGEFQRILKILVLSTDSVLVVEDQSQRATLLSPDLTVVRVFTLPVPPYDVVEVQPNLLAAAVAAPNTEGSITFFDLNGEAVESVLPFNPGSGPPLPRVIAAGDGGAWSTRIVGDREVLWVDRDGGTSRTVRLGSEWVGRAKGGVITPESPPTAQVRGLWRDDRNQLWVLASIADVEWAKGLGEPTRGEGGSTSHRIEDRDRVFDTVLEVYDIGTGALVASRRLDREYRTVPFPGVIGRITEDPERGTVLELTTVSLQEPGAGGQSPR